MIPISRSKIDIRYFSIIPFFGGVIALLIGISNQETVLLLISFVMISLGLLIIFKGKPTYCVFYDEENANFLLARGRESIQINKYDLISVEESITLFQTWWPLPRHYYYLLTVKNNSGTVRYKFVIWSNEPDLLLNYSKLKRSITKWKKENVHSR